MVATVAAASAHRGSGDSLFPREQIFDATLEVAGRDVGVQVFARA
jgi:hypothetical protein